MLVKGRGKRGKYWNKEEEGTRTTVQVQRKKKSVCLDCDGAFERERSKQSEPGQNVETKKKDRRETERKS